MKKLYPVLLALFIGGLITINGCKKEDLVKTVTVEVNLPQGGARALIDSVTLKVTGSDFAGFEATKYVSPTMVTVTFELQLQNDNTYTFFVTAKDSTGAILYWGRLEVNFNGNASIDITVEPAAQGAANHIKLFRDNLPWSSSAMDSMLSSQGYTPGTGENQYEIIPSTAFDTVTLRPGTDLVIIVNDQTQEFYDRYATNMTKFNQFVQRGGIIFWEACDRGWHYGSILEAGITFPGGAVVDSNYVYDHYNTLYNASFELVSDLPDTLYGTYSSHETFRNLPQNAQIFTLNLEEGRPTLVLYNYGLGWIMITGQPLEYNYDRLPEQTTGLLLSRIVNFILGNQGGGTLNHTGKATDSRTSAAR